MNGSSILNKIIQEDGSCCWATKSVCASCPMNKLRQRDNGTFLSCVESIGVENLSEEEADAKYKEVAERLLLSEAIDEILGEVDGTKQ